MKSQDLYQQLAELSKKATLLHSIFTILEWDQETYMPPKAIQVRSSEIELLASLVHKERTSDSFVKLLGALIDLKTGKVIARDLQEAQQAALRQWHRDYVKTVKLPSSFVEEFARVTSTSMHAWKEAKRTNDFALFCPHLEKVVELCRKKAELFGYKDHPYDALLDEFEPDMTTKVVKVLFERLKTPLIYLLKEIQTKPQPDSSFLHQMYPHEQQLRFAKKMLAAMGFDKSFSRLDESTHPMCISSHPKDVRMTTRVYSHSLMPNLLSAIHEGGHGLYEAHLPEAHYGTPLCQSISLGIHESQSRLWETILGRSFPFWHHFLPLLQQEYPAELGAVSLDDFYRAINLVKPSMIRVDSDEVTYNLHIMLRFELECGLIEGSLKVKDLPHVWNDKMRDYLGISPKADSEGCLQDIHWAMGGIGYFPTYTLGNLYAAQFFDTFTDVHPDWQEKVMAGELGFLREWLKHAIHQYGRQYLPEELCEKVTGKPLSEHFFMDYLKAKYRSMYHLS